MASRCRSAAAVCISYHLLALLLQADGSEFDSSRGRGPLEFVVGSSNVIEGFHDLVMGLGTGEKRTRTIEAKKAYGEWSEDLVAKVPASQAPDVSSHLHLRACLCLRGALSSAELQLFIKCHA